MRETTNEATAEKKSAEVDAGEQENAAMKAEKKTAVVAEKKKMSGKKKPSATKNTGSKSAKSKAGKAASAGKSKTDDVDAETGEGKNQKNLKRLTKTKAAEAWPNIMDTMVKKAKQGSVNHAKFLVDLGGLKDEEPQKQKPEKTLSGVLLGAYKKKVSETAEKKNKQQGGETKQ